jgi:DNA primase
MFPITNESGKVIAFTGRTLASDEKSGPKYLNSPETPIYSKSRVLFNLDKAKEPIRKLEYAILVEGQMDCISVYTAGFRNVIASSGTAFTELQARLLGRFSKNIVVNFDPDTAGAAAAERSLALLVSEEFQIKVLTLEAGFDPDLYIRRKGVAAYGDALSHSQKYFDYLIERARELFPPRSPEAKVKAMNYLVPYLQQVPNVFTRTEILQEMAQKLALDSEFLRKQFRQLIARRGPGQVQLPNFAKLTESEEILVQALVCTGALGHGQRDSREPDPEFDPARETFYWLSGRALSKGLPGEQLLGKLLDGYNEGLSLTDLPLTDSERTAVAEIGRGQRHTLTPENVRGAIIGVRKAAISRQLKELQSQIDKLRTDDRDGYKKLWSQREELKMAMRSSTLEDPSSTA